MNIYRIAHPFVLEDYYAPPDEDGFPPAVKTWRPGVRFEACGPESSEAVAEGMGYQIVTVISTHKPGPKYPERVFYTRRWIDPDGKEFGKSNLHIKSRPAFEIMIKGYKYEFILVDESGNETTVAACG